MTYVPYIQVTADYFTWLENFLEYDGNVITKRTAWEDSDRLLRFNVFIFDIIWNQFEDPYLLPHRFRMVTSTFTIICIFIEMKVYEIMFLHDAFYFDVYSSIAVYFTKVNFHYYLNYRDYVTLCLHYNPELLIPFAYFYKNYISYYSTNFNVSVLNESIINNQGFLLLDFLTYWKFVVLSLFFLFLVVSTVRNNKISTNINFFQTRVYLYFYSISRENRIQFELLVQFFYFFILALIFALMSYNDSQVEFIELMHLSIFYFFLLLIVYLIYKYSIHYFAFLEASFIEGKSASFFAKQFVRDISNTFALFLRFFLLLFRLNIYDCLDDFLDSYYIFFCDFDDDTYYDETLIPFFSNINFFLPDNQTDANIFNDLETDLVEDIFQKYYISWSKMYMFWFFILEEGFRVSLALYITYLIIFEVHSINVSYTEDTFFKIKKFLNKF